MTRRPPAPSAAEREAIDALSRAWDREPDAVWEPWEPKVGDLVRVRLSSECSMQFWELGKDGQPDREQTVGHHWAADGEAGVVRSICRAPFGPLGLPSRGHSYQVESMLDGVLIYYAASELIPLAPAARPHDDDDGAEGQ